MSVAVNVSVAASPRSTTVGQLVICTVGAVVSTSTAPDAGDGSLCTTPSVAITR